MGVPPGVRRSGRNELCWCGSGKKYKKCHLREDEQRDRRAAGRDAPAEQSAGEASSPVVDALLTFAIENMSKKETLQALKQLLGYHPDEMSDDDQIAFGEWLIHDYCPKRFRRPAIIEYLARHGDSLPPAQRRELEERVNSRYGLFEVRRVDPGVGVEIHDVFRGEDFFIHDVNSSHGLTQWDGLLARMRSDGDRQVFVGELLSVPRHFYPTFRDWIRADRERANLPWSSYFRANSHLLRRRLLGMAESWSRNVEIRNSDDEPLVIAEAAFAVLDAPRTRALLDSEDCFTFNREEQGTVHYHWSREIPDDPDGTLLIGSVRLTPGELVLECNSRERMDRGIDFIRRLAGDALGEVRRNIELPRHALRESPTDPPRQLGEEIPPEIKAKLLTEYYAKHYETWPDTPLPALGGMTPREAAVDPEQRTHLIELLKTFESMEDRKRHAGEPCYDFSQIKKTLGVEF